MTNGEITFFNQISSFFCSWSGGKDSCLALYRAIKEGGRPRLLLTMLTEGNERSRSHGLPVNLIQKQASALGIPLVTRAATWDSYEREFISALREIKKEEIAVGVFGDIDLEDHRKWVERVCASAAIQPYHPLWKKERHDLLKELLEAGFTAMIVAAKDGVLDKRFLGRTINEDVIKDIVGEGIDASGEGGEYHTVVIDGPIFSHPINLEMGDQVLRDGYWFIDVSVK
jgi:uncharacterized protein (TIGR00290 family)